MSTFWDDLGYGADPFGRPTKGGSLSSWWTSRVSGFGWTSFPARFSSEDERLLRKTRALKTAARIGRLALGERTAKELTFGIGKAHDTEDSHHVGVDISAANLDPKELEKELGWDEAHALDAAVGSALTEGTLATFPSKHKRETWRERANVALYERISDFTEDGPAKHYQENAIYYAGSLLMGATAPLAAQGASYDSFPGFDGYFETHLEWLRRPSLQQKIRSRMEDAEENPFARSALAVFGEALAPGAFIDGDSESPLDLPDPDLVKEVARDLRTAMKKARSLEKMAAVAAEAVSRLLKFFPDNTGDATDEMHQLASALSGFREDFEPNGKEEDDKVEEMALRDLRDETPTHAQRQPNYSPDPTTHHAVPVWSMRPPLDAYIRELYHRSRLRVMGLVNRTREALAFRNEQAFFDDRPLVSGHVDPGAAHKLALGDVRVFARREIEEPPNVVVGVLVDESGSMCAYSGARDEENVSMTRADVARDCAVLFHEALRNERGVVLRIWGHDTSFGTGAVVYRYEQAESLGHIGARAANLDGAAIGYCVEEMRRLTEEHGLDGHPAEGVLFVLCDGMPDGLYTVDSRRRSYRGEAAYDHTLEAVQLGRRHGLTVIGFGMGDDLSPKAMEFCFGPGGFEFVPKVPELPVRLQRALLRAMREKGAAGA